MRVSYGQIAYEAYVKSTSGLTYDGRTCPLWPSLPVRIQSAWEAAANAALAKLTIELAMSKARADLDLDEL